MSLAAPSRVTLHLTRASEYQGSSAHGILIDELNTERRNAYGLILCTLFYTSNDYMFRYILEKNKKVLIGLVSALLHLRPEEIKELNITNPILLNDNIRDKEFILDVKVLLNNDKFLELEMQVVNHHNWEDRSLTYLCRAFDQLSRGQEYEQAFPVTHIGFLDFTLFEDKPEFYATNMLLNIKTHQIFNSKFKLSVVDLSQIELATEEDKAWGLDYWARLFKAKTWEEIKMLAEKNEYLQEAAQSVYMANEDDIIRDICLAREEAERHERTMKRDMQDLKNTVAKQKEQLNENAIQLNQQEQQLNEKNLLIAELKQKLAEATKE